MSRECSAALSVHVVELLCDRAVASPGRRVSPATGATNRAHDTREVCARVLHGSEVCREKLSQRGRLVIGRQRRKGRVRFCIENGWRELHA